MIASVTPVSALAEEAIPLAEGETSVVAEVEQPSEAETPAVTEQPAEEPAETEAPAETPAVTEQPAGEPEETEAPAETPAVTEQPAEEPAATETPAGEPAAEQDPEEESGEDGILMDASAGAAYSLATSAAEYAESNANARDANGDDFYKIVHVDAGRKYFSPENIKKIIDNAAAAGFNQVELYLSDNQGFRFALDDMNVTTSTGNTYDLTPALGDGYSDGSKYPDGSGKYLTQSEMDDIINYAKSKGIDIVPCINVPGHMGAILEEFTQFKYSGSNSSIDLENAEAVAFALAITEKYATYFESQGVKYYNLGADEYANDLSTMGFQGLYISKKYQNFVGFLNSAAQIVINHGMTPRAFNDGIYYNEDNTYSINSAIQVCYWSCGWNDYKLASAQYLVNKGMDVINTHGDYYWVLGNTGWQCSANKASQFNYTSFQYRTGTTGNGTISDPAGAMFCIWCDVGNADGTDGGTAVVSATADVIAAFGAALPNTDKTHNNEDIGVSITAPRLNSFTCTQLTENLPNVEGAAEGKVLAFDMEPQTDLGKYTGQGTVSIAVPEGWNTEKLTGFVVESDNSVTKITGTYKSENNTYTFTMPHFSTGGIAELADSEAEDTEPKTITVTMGGTATDTISGTNYANGTAYATDNPSIATVEVTGTDATKATTTYTQASVTCNTLISSDSSNSSNWTAASGYYYTPDGTNYYPVYAKRSSSRFLFWSTYTYTWGYSTTSSTSDVTQIGTQETDSTRTTPNITVYTKSGTDGTPASTTVTFNGVTVGTTYVTVGNTRYTINVVAEDLSKVTPLTVEFWITNQKVTANRATSMTIAASASGVYSESGALFSSLVPATGTQGGNTMVFWKGTVQNYDASDVSSYHDYGHQNTAGGNDRTKKGHDFTYVRYWERNWSYSADGKSWTLIDTGNNDRTVNHMNDQVVAYYLQKTEVTDEITTLVSDYGNVPGYASSLSPFVMVDYAVKYESGERTPDVFPTAKTIAFHCNYNSSADVGNTVIEDDDTYYRKLGTIKAVETAEYEVYMITLTPTSDTKTEAVAQNAMWATNYTYEGTEKVVWVDDEANLGDFADESKHYTSPSGEIKYTVGGEPNIAGLEIYMNQCMLVTYYVRAKVTEDSLAVHYIDQTANQEFYSYNIAVKSGTLFDENIGLANPWKGNLANGSVTNLQDKTQTVSADLSTMPAIGAQYRYSDYTCVKVERSEDGKYVYLYYTFNNAHSFVVDFGLPLTITTTDLGISGDWTSASVSGAKYGTATATVGEGLTYTPTETLKGVEILQLTLTDSIDSGTVTHQIYIYPATTVYYEEGFAKFTEGGFTGGSKGNGTQATEVAGKKNYNYGYDPAYERNAGPSNGTQAVSSGTTVNDVATFTFTGTAVDIYTNNDTSTGVMMVQVKDSSNKTVKLLSMDTQMANGTTDATTGQAVEAKNVPSVTFDLVTLGTYTVKISHVKRSNTEENTDPLKLDGFRVYNTLGNINDAYQEDGENSPLFVELRDHVLSAVGIKSNSDSQYKTDQQIVDEVFADNTTKSGAIVLTSGTTDNAKDLLDNGPKNEIYLRKNESVTFTLANGVTAQIGMKVLNTGSTKYKLDNAEKTLTSQTDMFCETVSGEVTIQNTGDGILSITKLKVFGATDKDSVFTAPTTTAVAYAARRMGAVASSADPVTAAAALTVNVVDEQGAVLASNELTAEGTVGESHTFPATDITKAVPAVDGYTVDISAAADVTVPYGETQTVTFTAVQDKPEPTPEPTPEPEPQPNPGQSIISGIINTIKNTIKNIFNGIFGRRW